MNYSGYVELGAWVTGQRFLLKLQVDKKVEESNRRMEAQREERIILLNKIGFEWDDSGSKWDEKYEEMKMFMRKFGDIYFAQQYLQDTTELGIWVNQQKVNYERYLGGDKTSVSKRQIKLLTDVGFSFGAFKSHISAENIPKYNIPDQSNGKPVLPSNVIKYCNSGNRNETATTFFSSSHSQPLINIDALEDCGASQRIILWVS
uniref:Helicase-associated domain-containing protein n=1 Tax=Proboscia inermis TaxID=420281 RepID=A0A7S0CF67_9STRA|mmetsp:Transcript_42931/g.43530  ORF Transcript_42931/g.43530 Transcript_42931/m.43530 type:complete len:204 (+) Transcript_42931:573-1184(+)